MKLIFGKWGRSCNYSLFHLHVCNLSKVCCGSHSWIWMDNQWPGLSWWAMMPTAVVVITSHSASDPLFKPNCFEIIQPPLGCCVASASGVRHCINWMRVQFIIVSLNRCFFFSLFPLNRFVVKWIIAYFNFIQRLYPPRIHIIHKSQRWN